MRSEISLISGKSSVSCNGHCGRGGHHHFDGFVVKTASLSPGGSRLKPRASLTSDLQTGTLVATAPDAWPFRAGAWTCRCSIHL